MKNGAACVPPMAAISVAAAAGVLMVLAAVAHPALAQDASREARPFFAGKTVRIIVGLPPGGGADAYARLVQRHFARHVAGTPSIIVQNMPGAGTLRSVMALGAAPEDGTVIGTCSSALITEAIAVPERVKVDFRKYAFVGNVSEDVRVCYVWGALGVRSWQDLRARPHPIRRDCDRYGRQRRYRGAA